MSKAHTGTDGPGDLKELRMRLDAWRCSPGRGRRIPEEYWEEAVALCRVHSMSTVSRHLGLSYSTLKTRFHGCLPREAPAASFLEIPRLFGAEELTIEYQRAPGKMLRIHCRGSVPERVLDLVETLGRGAS
jgi:AraC-like DNA-binding protein